MAIHVAIIDQTNVDGRPLEIYAAAPAFDSCGRALLQPLSVDALDETQGKARALPIRDGEVALEYTRNAAEATELSQLKIPRR